MYILSEEPMFITDKMTQNDPLGGREIKIKIKKQSMAFYVKKIKTLVQTT